jgi:HEAT repeat protein
MLPSNKLILPCWIVVGLLAPLHLTAAEMPVEDAWKALPKYEPGQDMAALLAIDRAVIDAMTSPQTRSACAARLASVLADADTTPAARQYICLQLRQIGTAAEVPLLAELLMKPETSQIARYALETIPGPEAASALRGALTTLDGKLLLGVIQSVAARKDAAAVPTLVGLADSSDRQVADAAIWALGNVADDQAIAFLTSRADKAGIPTPQGVAVPLLRCATVLAESERAEVAQAIYTMLSQSNQTPAIRRAALQGTLALSGGQMMTTVLAWFSGSDPDRRRIAAGRLHTLSNEQLDRLLSQLPDLPDGSKLAVMELAASRRGKQVLPMLISLMKSDKPELRLAGVRFLGMVGDASVIPQLVEMLSADNDLNQAAQDALLNLPRAEVTAALLDALKNRPANRVPVIAVLVKLKCYDAIDPLVEIALQTDPAVYGPALDGLCGIADPDKTDIPRLVKLLLQTEPGPASRRSGTNDSDCLRQAACHRRSIRTCAGRLGFGRRIRNAELPSAAWPAWWSQVLGDDPARIEEHGSRHSRGGRASLMQLAECRCGPQAARTGDESGEPDVPPVGFACVHPRSHTADRPTGIGDAEDASAGNEVSRRRGRTTPGHRTRLDDSSDGDSHVDRPVPG